MKFIISRTDAIGDVILTLPLTGILKELYPDAKIYFLAKQYTKAVVSTCSHVDEFINFDELQKLNWNDAVNKIQSYSCDAILHVFPNKTIAKLAKDALVPIRLGTRNRFYHWFTCNKLIKLSRKNSNLHETQLNLFFAQYFGYNNQYTLKELHKFYGFDNKEILLEDYNKLLSKDKLNIILHPKSNASAREWGFDNFNKLIKLLTKTNQVKIFVTGIEKERNIIEENIQFNDNVINLAGKLTLEQLISFIEKCDALVAASTGPLHIASMAGINAIGLYPPIKPMHPGRWAPIGAKAKYFVKDIQCKECKNTIICKCLHDITPETIMQYILLNCKTKNI